MQTDGYAESTYLAILQNVTHLSCWVHAHRYFEKALKNDQASNNRLEYFQKLYHIEAESQKNR